MVTTYIGSCYMYKSSQKSNAPSPPSVASVRNRRIKGTPPSILRVSCLRASTVVTWIVMSILSIRADSTCDSTYFPHKKVKNVEKWGLQLKNEETGWSKKIAKNAQNMKLTKVVTSCDFFLIPPRKHSWVVEKCKRPHEKMFSFMHFS